MNLVILTSPFVFDKPVPPEDLVGREEILATITDRAAHGRFMLLAAPRRYGKTSIVHRLASDGATTGDLHVVHVDLLGVQHLGDVGRRFARAIRSLPTGRLRKAIEKLVNHMPEVAATLGWGALTVTARRGERASEGATLETLLDLPARAAAHLRATVLVVLDEFQDIADVTGADTTIRSVIQHQQGAVSYLFAGSEPSTMDAIFADHRRALYAQAERITLGPLSDEALGAFVEDRFASTDRTIAAGVVPEYLAFVSGHPQRAMLIAHHLWSVTEDGGCADRERLATAVDDALLTYTYEGSRMLQGLTATQAKVARLIAHDEPVHGAAAKAVGLAKSSASQALRALRSATVVTAAPDTSLLDPLFAEWLRRELPLD